MMFATRIGQLGARKVKQKPSDAKGLGKEVRRDTR